VTDELPPIVVGQRWRARGERDRGRTVTVTWVDPVANRPGCHGLVTVQGKRKSTLRARTLHSRYQLLHADPIPETT